MIFGALNNSNFGATSCVRLILYQDQVVKISRQLDKVCITNWLKFLFIAVEKIVIFGALNNSNFGATSCVILI